MTEGGTDPLVSTQLSRVRALRLATLDARRLYRAYRQGHSAMVAVGSDARTLATNMRDMALDMLTALATQEPPANNDAPPD